MKSTFKTFFLSAVFLCALALSAFAQDYVVLQSDSTKFTTTQVSSSRVIKDNFSVVAVVTDITPSAATFTAASATDICTTSAAHGAETGLKVQVSNSGGALPTGLSASTDYYVIKVSSTTFKLATSLANAQAGTAINITADGSGTQTVTPTSLAGGAVKLQGSIDGVNFVDIASSSQSVTASVNLIWNQTSQKYNYVRASSTVTAGQLKAIIQYSDNR